MKTNSGGKCWHQASGCSHASQLLIRLRSHLPAFCGAPGMQPNPLGQNNDFQDSKLRVLTPLLLNLFTNNFKPILHELRAHSWYHERKVKFASFAPGEKDYYSENTLYSCIPTSMGKEYLLPTEVELNHVACFQDKHDVCEVGCISSKLSFYMLAVASYWVHVHTAFYSNSKSTWSLIIF